MASIESVLSTSFCPVDLGVVKMFVALGISCQVMYGVGLPLARQVKVISSPFVATMSCGCTVMLGAAGGHDVWMCVGVYDHVLYFHDTNSTCTYTLLLVGPTYC